MRWARTSRSSRAATTTLPPSRTAPSTPRSPPGSPRSSARPRRCSGGLRATSTSTAQRAGSRGRPTWRDVPASRPGTCGRSRSSPCSTGTGRRCGPRGRLAARYGALTTVAVMDLSLADLALGHFDRAGALEAARVCAEASRRYGLATEPVAHLWLATPTPSPATTPRWKRRSHRRSRPTRRPAHPRRPLRPSARHARVRRRRPRRAARAARHDDDPRPRRRSVALGVPRAGALGGAPRHRRRRPRLGGPRRVRRGRRSRSSMDVFRFAADRASRPSSWVAPGTASAPPRSSSARGRGGRTEGWAPAFVHSSSCSSPGPRSVTGGATPSRGCGRRGILRRRRLRTHGPALPAADGRGRRPGPAARPRRRRGAGRAAGAGRDQPRGRRAQLWSRSACRTGDRRPAVPVAARPSSATWQPFRPHRGARPRRARRAGPHPRRPRWVSRGANWGGATDALAPAPAATIVACTPPSTRSPTACTACRPACPTSPPAASPSTST